MQRTLINALAVARLVRLVREDEITRPARERIYKRLLDDWPVSDWEWDAWVDHRVERAPWALKLMRCPWCLAVWIAVLSALAGRLMPRTWRAASEALAVAYAAAVIEDLSHTYAEG